MGDKAYKLRHKKLGLCISCTQPANTGDYYCIEHRYKKQRCDIRYYYKNKVERRHQVEARRQRYKEEGKCPDCGIPLIEGEGVYCINCQGRY